MSDTPLISGPNDPGSLRALLNGVVNAINRLIDGGAYGELIISASAATLTLTTQDVWYKIASNWVADEVKNTALDAAQGTIAPLRDGPFCTIASVSFSTAEAANTLEFAIFRNGSAIADHLAVTWIDSQTYPNTVAITGIVVLDVGDELDLRVRCTTAADVVITPTNANFSIFRIGVSL